MKVAWISKAATDYLRREQGSSSEYALLLAMAGAAVAGVFLMLSVQIENAALDSAACFSKAPGCTLAVTIKSK